MSEAERQIPAIGLMIQIRASHRQAKGNAYVIDIGHGRVNIDPKLSRAGGGSACIGAAPGDIAFSTQPAGLRGG